MSGPAESRGGFAPTRVLSLGGGAGAPVVSGALTAAGHEVETWPNPSALPNDAPLAGFDVIVLDLTHGGLSGEALSHIGSALGRLRESDSPAPFVLGLTADGRPPAVGAAIADDWIEPARAAAEAESAFAARRLQHAQRQIEELRRIVLHARRIAHDLAQPLTTVLGRSQLVLRQMDPEDPHHRPLSLICQEADRLAHLVEQFQTLKQMQRGKPPGQTGGAAPG